jgi:hypothetical protein
LRRAADWEDTNTAAVKFTAWCQHMDVSLKMKDAYVSRMSPELKEKFLALSAEEQTAIINALMRFHQVIEEETYALLQGILAPKTAKQ